MKESIGIDMDEVLADTLSHHLTTYNSEFGEHLSADDVIGKRLYDALPEERRRAMRAYLDDAHFFTNIPPMEGSIEVMASLVKQYEVFVVSAAMQFPNSLSTKFSWLRRHFTFVEPENIIFCTRKSMLGLDHLIDDNAHHFEGFRGRACLFSAPHNVNENRYMRINNWMHLQEIFL